MGFATIEDVLIYSLKDLLSAEKQFKAALAKLAEAANEEELSSAFRDHHKETVTHIERLERCFELMGKSPRSEKFDAAAGLASEGESIIKEGGEPPASDRALISAGRKTEHYEIASYEDAICMATAFGHNEVVSLLRQTLEEERAADERLAMLGSQLCQSAAAEAR